ncbi:MAG: hypothetical protein RQ723_10930 [Desulfuromonadales bacterium]|nr:hypothetical protein [Desulfuromonadales bacterium]
MMLALHPQYLTDEQNRRKAVVLPLDEWEGILAALQELDDVMAYDQAKAGRQDKISFEQAVHEIEQGYRK